MTKRYRIKIRNIAMGVPITFLDKYNPNQFEIETNSTMSGVSANFWTYINGSPKYARIFIRKKPKKTRQYRVKVRNIVMGVPITFLDKYCPKQFEIVGLDRYVEDNPNFGHRFHLNKKEVYARILIKHVIK